MADTVYKDATGGQVRYEDVVTDASTNRRIPKSVPADKDGDPLFGSDNPGYVIVTGGNITFPSEVEIKNTDGAPIPTTDAGLGTDGASPPALAGTGVRGWLRGIYERLTGTLAISATSLPLPTGAATSAAQGAANTSLSSIDTKTPALAGGRVPVDGSGATQPISATALPLPAGASTSANQATGNTTLASILSALGLVITRRSGSTGADFSSAPLAVTGTLLATIPANPNRNYAEAQNLSTAAVQLVRDDGNGSAQTVMLLNPAAAAGMVGGSWFTDTFKGRLRVYGATGASVVAFED